MELKTDFELINEFIKKKSNNAARILVERHRQFVYAIAFRCTKSHDDADDLAQEVFIKMFENLHNFAFKSSLKTWLYRITINAFLNTKLKRNIGNVLKKENLENIENNLKNDNNPEKEFEYNELVEQFEKALNSLPERQREVFSLRYFDEMKYDEISELLGLTVGGLKANYFHAVKKLSELLKPYTK